MVWLLLLLLVVLLVVLLLVVLLLLLVVVAVVVLVVLAVWGVFEVVWMGGGVSSLAALWEPWWRVGRGRTVCLVMMSGGGAGRLSPGQGSWRVALLRCQLPWRRRTG